MADTEAEPPVITNGISTEEEDERLKQRPADIDADVREMERRKRVDIIMSSKIFREELERILDAQLREGGGAGILQQISDMMGVPASRVHAGTFKSSNCVLPINDIRGMEGMGYEKGEKILRCKLAALYRLMDLYGWTQGNDNQITARLNADEEVFLTAPRGLLCHEVTASSLVKVDMQGAVIDQGTTNFPINVNSFMLHSWVHAARPDIRCIVQIRAPAILAVGALRCGLLPLSREAALLGDVAAHHCSAGVLDPEEREKLVRSLGPHSKVLLLQGGGGGALCCGATAEEAWLHARCLAAAADTQTRLAGVPQEALLTLGDEARKQIYDEARRPPKDSGPKWRVGGEEFEALMRMLDNAGFRTGYIYRQPLVKGEVPKPRNDIEVPPAVSSLGYLLEEEEFYKQGLWKKMEGGRKSGDRTRWLNSPNVYQKVEVLETGTSDPKKITKWVGANAEEWVADGSPAHANSTPVKIDCAMQFVPKNTNPKEFKQLQQQIKDYRRADKLSAGPQSHILEGVTWDEASKIQDASATQTGDHVVLMGAASKGIIQRGHQHNAAVYKAPYAKNPFDAVTDDEINEYKRTVERKARGEFPDDTDYSESEALSGAQIMSPSEAEDESRTEPRVLRIETKHAPKPSQPEVVLSDVNTDLMNMERSMAENNSFKVINPEPYALSDDNPFSDDEDVFSTKEEQLHQVLTLSEESVPARGVFADSTLIVRQYKVPTQQHIFSKETPPVLVSDPNNPLTEIFKINEPSTAKNVPGKLTKGVQCAAVYRDKKIQVCLDFNKLFHVPSNLECDELSPTKISSARVDLGSNQSPNLEPSDWSQTDTAVNRFQSHFSEVDVKHASVLHQDGRNFIPVRRPFYRTLPKIKERSTLNVPGFLNTRSHIEISNPFPGDFSILDGNINEESNQKNLRNVLSNGVKRRSGDLFKFYRSNSHSSFLNTFLNYSKPLHFHIPKCNMYQYAQQRLLKVNACGLGLKRAVSLQEMTENPFRFDSTTSCSPTSEQYSPFNTTKSYTRDAWFDFDTLPNTPIRVAEEANCDVNGNIGNNAISLTSGVICRRALLPERGIAEIDIIEGAVSPTDNTIENVIGSSEGNVGTQTREPVKTSIDLFEDSFSISDSVEVSLDGDYMNFSDDIDSSDHSSGSDYENPVRDLIDKDIRNYSLPMSLYAVELSSEELLDNALREPSWSDLSIPKKKAQCKRGSLETILEESKSVYSEDTASSSVLSTDVSKDFSKDIRNVSNHRIVEAVTAEENYSMFEGEEVGKDLDNVISSIEGIAEKIETSVDADNFASVEIDTRDSEIMDVKLAQKFEQIVKTKQIVFENKIATKIKDRLFTEDDKPEMGIEKNKNVSGLNAGKMAINITNDILHRAFKMFQINMDAAVSDSKICLDVCIPDDTTYGLSIDLKNELLKMVNDKLTANAAMLKSDMGVKDTNVRKEISIEIKELVHLEKEAIISHIIDSVLKDTFSVIDLKEKSAIMRRLSGISEALKILDTFDSTVEFECVELMTEIIENFSSFVVVKMSADVSTSDAENSNGSTMSELCADFVNERGDLMAHLSDFLSESNNFVTESADLVTTLCDLVEEVAELLTESDVSTVMSGDLSAQSHHPVAEAEDQVPCDLLLGFGEKGDAVQTGALTVVSTDLVAEVFDLAAKADGSMDSLIEAEPQSFVTESDQFVDKLRDLVEETRDLVVESQTLLHKTDDVFVNLENFNESQQIGSISVANTLSGDLIYKNNSNKLVTTEKCDKTLVSSRVEDCTFDTRKKCSVVAVTIEKRKECDRRQNGKQRFNSVTESETAEDLLCKVAGKISDCDPVNVNASVSKSNSKICNKKKAGKSGDCQIRVSMDIGTRKSDISKNDTGSLKQNSKSSKSKHKEKKSKNNKGNVAVDPHPDICGDLVSNAGINDCKKFTSIKDISDSPVSSEEIPQTKGMVCEDELKFDSGRATISSEITNEKNSLEDVSRANEGAMVQGNVDKSIHHGTIEENVLETSYVNISSEFSQDIMNRNIKDDDVLEYGFDTTLGVLETRNTPLRDDSNIFQESSDPSVVKFDLNNAFVDFSGVDGVENVSLTCVNRLIHSPSDPCSSDSLQEVYPENEESFETMFQDSFEGGMSAHKRARQFGTPVPRKRSKSNYFNANLSISSMTHDCHTGGVKYWLTFDEMRARDTAVSSFENRRFSFTQDQEKMPSFLTGEFCEDVREPASRLPVKCQKGICNKKRFFYDISHSVCDDSDDGFFLRDISSTVLKQCPSLGDLNIADNNLEEQSESNNCLVDFIKDEKIQLANSSSHIDVQKQLTKNARHLNQSISDDYYSAHQSTTSVVGSSRDSNVEYERKLLYRCRRKRHFTWPVCRGRVRRNITSFSFNANDFYSKM